MASCRVLSEIAITAVALPLADVLAAEQEDQQRLGLTEDHRDAVAAFLSKQRPVFRGR